MRQPLFAVSAPALESPTGLGRVDRSVRIAEVWTVTRTTGHPTAEGAIWANTGDSNKASRSIRRHTMVITTIEPRWQIVLADDVPRTRTGRTAVTARCSIAVLHAVRVI
jgi:hypothetical protein